MWTVCWKSKENGDGWDRFTDRDDVINLTNTLVREGGVEESDILIFPPEADILKIPYDNLEDRHNSLPLKESKDEPDQNKKRCKCSHDRFSAHQRCYHNIIVDSDNSFVDNVDIYDSEKPYGPYSCEKCGAEYDDLDNLYRFIRVRFHHEDSGFCKTTFKTIGKKQQRYYNRHDDGGWYTVYPTGGYWESDTPVKKEIIFQIVNKKGDVLFTESNSFRERPFTSVNIFIGNTAKAYAKEHNLADHEQWKQYMSSCPEYEEFIKKDYRENWLYSKREVIETKILDSFTYLDFKYNIAEVKVKHKISGLEYLSYEIQLLSDDCGDMCGGDICGYKLLSNE